jgi:hypothetical protein
MNMQSFYLRCEAFNTGPGIFMEMPGKVCGGAERHKVLRLRSG